MKTYIFLFLFAMFFLLSSCNKAPKKVTSGDTPSVLTVTSATQVANQTESINNTTMLNSQNETSVFEPFYSGITEIIEKESVEIIVEFSSTDSILKVFENADDGWTEIVKSSAQCGKNGVSDNKKEGDLCTPLGLYKIDKPFGIQQSPNGVENYTQITSNMYWVDDSDSKYYNQLVDVTKITDKDWNSSEHLIDYQSAYAYGMVIEYNTNPIVPGKGSAIFLHCGQNKTYGCIAVPKEIMIEILKLLNGKNAYILIR